jgi:hypothetical protein
VAGGNNKDSAKPIEPHSNVPSGSKSESGDVSKSSSHSTRLYKAVNRPLFVTVVGGLLVFAISVQVQHNIWKKEAEFMLDRARIDRTWEAAHKAQEEMVKALGKRLAVTATLIAAHQNQVKHKQHVEDVKRYDNAFEEWDETSEVIRFQMAALFADPCIKAKWDALQDDLHALHEDIVDLEEYTPTKPSSEQDDQAQKCKDHITQIEAEIDKLSQLMTAYAASGAKALSACPT